MNIQDITKEIEQNDAILIYFSAKNCAVCEVLQPKIESTFKKNFPKIKQLTIQSDQYPKIASHFHIFSAPSVLIFFDKKESKRESRHISVDELIQSTKRTYDLFFN